MMMIPSAMALTLAQTLGGCTMVQSETPMYEASQRVKDASWDGIWVGPDSFNIEAEPHAVVLRLAAGADHSHWMSCERIPSPPADPEPVKMHIDLVRVGGSLMVFVRKDDPAVREMAGYPFPLYRLTRHDDRMALDWVNSTAAADAIHAQPEGLRHDWFPATGPVATSSNSLATWPPGVVVLRASAAEVQQFLLDNEHDGRIFVRVAELKKVGP